MSNEDDSVTNDILRAILENETFSRAVNEVPEKERPNAEAAALDVSRLVSPLVAALTELSKSEEAINIVLAKLAEKPGSR